MHRSAAGSPRNTGSTRERGIGDGLANVLAGFGELDHAPAEGVLRAGVIALEIPPHELRGQHALRVHVRHLAATVDPEEGGRICAHELPDRPEQGGHDRLRPEAEIAQLTYVGERGAAFHAAGAESLWTCSSPVTCTTRAARLSSRLLQYPHQIMVCIRKRRQILPIRDRLDRPLELRMLQQRLVARHQHLVGRRVPV